jgi:hypothetical protein
MFRNFKKHEDFASFVWLSAFNLPNLIKRIIAKYRYTGGGTVISTGASRFFIGRRP